MRIAAVLKSKKCRIVWFDMKQPSKEETNKTANGEDEDNWWPGIGRWRLGMECEDAVLDLGHPEILDGRKTK